MLHLPGAGYPDSSASPTSSSRGRLKSWGKTIMKSHRISFGGYADLPLRIRPFFLLLSCLVMLLLAAVGFTDFTDRLPINDKILHFTCLAIATGVLYWVIDVDEDVRRVWIWRNASLLITGFFCFVLGSIVSEIVQSLLPHNEFHIGDVTANLFGSAVGLTTSYHLERYYRHRREISRLYRPVDAPEEESDEEDEEGSLLPIHQPNKPNGVGQIRLGNVWDETDEGSGGIFAIGDEEDLSARLTPGPGSPWISSVAAAKRSPSLMPPFGGPKIVITAPSTASLHDSA